MVIQLLLTSDQLWNFENKLLKFLREILDKVLFSVIHNPKSKI